MSNKKEQQEEVVEAIEKVEETTEQPKEEVKAEEKVEEKKEEPKKPAAEVADDGTIKIDLRNFKKEEETVNGCTLTFFTLLDYIKSTVCRDSF